MTDKAIPQLPFATLPLTGSEMLEVVQNDDSRQVATVDVAKTIIDPDPAMAANSNALVPSQAAVKTNITALNSSKEPVLLPGTPAQYYRGDKTWQTLDKNAVGLGNVDNTSDLNKPISTATQAALNLKADLASPVFTGDPRAPTPATADNDTSIATTAYVKAQGYLTDAPSDANAYGRKSGAWIAVVTSASYTASDVLAKLLTVDGAGSTLDADLLDGQQGTWYLDRANHTGTQAIATVSGLQAALDAKASLTYVDSQDALKANIASPAFTGNPTAPTPTAGDNDTSIATTAFVTTAILNLNLATTYAPIASPTFTGDPKAPTPATADNDTSIATTAFVKAQNYLNDAPTDGVTYGRQNGAWVPTASGLAEAPSDGALYGRVNAAWVKGVKLAGDTMTGALIIAPAVGSTGQLFLQPAAGLASETVKSADDSSTIVLDKAAVNGKVSAIYAKRNALSRWDLLLGEATNETGGNAGSDFRINRYTDAGALIDAVMQIIRSSGAAVFSQAVSAGGGITATGNIQGLNVVANGGNVYVGGTSQWIRTAHIVIGNNSYNTAGGIQVLGLAGGRYNFFPLSMGNVTERHQLMAITPINTVSGVNANAGTNTDLTGSSPRMSIGAGGTGTMYLDNSYISASPPYDMGDGEVELFVYALMAKNGDIISCGGSDDPLWAQIRADEYVGNKAFKRVKIYKDQTILGKEEYNAALADAMSGGLSRGDAIQLIAELPVQAIEITHKIKNKFIDAPEFAHAYVSDPMVASGEATVVLLDPVSPLVRAMKQHRNSGESMCDLIHENGKPKHIKIGNEPMKRKGPKGLMIVGANWK